MEYIHLTYRRVCRQKPVIFREDDQFERCLRIYDVFIWITSGILGTKIYYFLEFEGSAGKGSVLSFFVSGIIFLIPIWSYWEMNSIQACIGGPYHYAYSLLPEIIAFSFGYLTLLSHLSGISFLLSRSGDFLDWSVFNGNLSAGLKKYTRYQDDAPDFLFTEYPHVLSLLISLIGLGVTSSTTSAAKKINSIFFTIGLTVLLMISVIMTGFADLRNFELIDGRHFIHTIVGSNLKTCTVFSPVILASYLGAEAVNPDKTIPMASFLAFLFNLVAVLVIPAVMNLAWKIHNLGDNQIMWGLMMKLQIDDFMHYPYMVGVVAASLCSLYLHSTAALRLLVAMGRDGLLFSVFSRVEHNINMPVKPMFIVALVTGLWGTFVKSDFLESLSHVTFMPVYIVGPYLTLLMRYQDDVSHLEGKVEKNDAKRWPYCLLIVSGLFLSTCTFGMLLSFNTFNWFIHEAYETPDLTIHCSVAGVATLAFLAVIYFQPQNTILTTYNVIGCPFTPVIGIFICSFLLPHIPTFFFIVIGFWMAPGYILYFAYSIKNSKQKLKD